MRWWWLNVNSSGASRRLCNRYKTRTSTVSRLSMHTNGSDGKRQATISLPPPMAIHSHVTTERDFWMFPLKPEATVRRNGALKRNSQFTEFIRIGKWNKSSTTRESIYGIHYKMKLYKCNAHLTTINLSFRNTFFRKRNINHIGKRENSLITYTDQYISTNILWEVQTAWFRH